MPHGGRHGPKPKKTTKKTKPKVVSKPGRSYMPPSKNYSNTVVTKPKAKVNQGVDPGLAKAVQNYVPPKQTVNPNLGNTYKDYVNQGLTNQNQIAAQSMKDAGITGLSGLGGVSAPSFVRPPPKTVSGDTANTTVYTKNEEEEEKKEKEKKEKEKKDNAKKTAQGLTDWWADPKNQLGQGRYKERKNIFTGKLFGSQEAVTEKLQDKLNKGFYKIVQGPKGQPLIIHASTGIPVNPYTGRIISTQTVDDQGGAYQNEMARITGIDSKFAGVFSKEYQTGNGLSVSEMKPEHALRFLMKKKPEAFEQFFNAQKEKKGFNPFSASFLTKGMEFVLGKLTGETALKVGNNLERAGWGKANKGEDGKYTVQLTKDGAQNWSDSFNFDEVSIGGKPYKGFTSPAAIEKGGSKIYTYLESLGINDPKFAKQPVDLSNLMDVGGTVNPANINKFSNPLIDPTNPMSGKSFDQRIGNEDFVQPPNLVTQYPFAQKSNLRGYDSIPGTPSDYNITGEGKIQNYPTYTPGGYKISAYNPTRDYSERTNDYTRNNIGGGGQDQNQDTTTPPPGPLTFDVFGRPITYDYSGGPEQIYLGGGYKRDGQYIGSPYGYSKGGIANFRPYGY